MTPASPVRHTSWISAWSDCGERGQASSAARVRQRSGRSRGTLGRHHHAGVAGDRVDFFHLRKIGQGHEILGAAPADAVDMHEGEQRFADGRTIQQGGGATKLAGGLQLFDTLVDGWGGEADSLPELRISGPRVAGQFA